MFLKRHPNGSFYDVYEYYFRYNEFDCVALFSELDGIGYFPSVSLSSTCCWELKRWRKSLHLWFWSMQEDLARLVCWISTVQEYQIFWDLTIGLHLKLLYSSGSCKMKYLPSHLGTGEKFRPQNTADIWGSDWFTQKLQRSSSQQLLQVTVQLSIKSKPSLTYAALSQCSFPVTPHKGLVSWCAQSVWETPTIQSACPVNTCTA